MPLPLLAVLLVAGLTLSCKPALTGKSVYIFTSDSDKAFYNDTALAASAEARRYGTKAENFRLQQLQSLLESPSSPPGNTAQITARIAAIGSVQPADLDAVVVVAYRGEWPNLLTEPIIGQLSQLRASGMRVGLWLVDRGSKPALPPELPPQIDAISSASSERAAKPLATPFFRKLFGK